MSEVSIVWCSVPSTQIADEISNALVKEKLCACIHILPEMTSVYSWQGEIHRDKEFMLMMKTKTSLINEVIVKVKSLHPYDTPEITCTKLSDGYPQYLNWVHEATK